MRDSWLFGNTSELFKTFDISIKNYNEEKTIWIITIRKNNMDLLSIHFSPVNFHFLKNNNL